MIAAEGPRSPDVEKSQNQFNIGIVVIVEHGLEPSRELIERANASRALDRLLIRHHRPSFNNDRDTKIMSDMLQSLLQSQFSGDEVGTETR